MQSAIRSSSIFSSYLSLAWLSFFVILEALLHMNLFEATSQSNSYDFSSFENALTRADFLMQASLSGILNEIAIEK